MAQTPTTYSRYVEIDAQALRERRQLRGETQRSLAERVGLTEHYIWRLERETRRHMRPSTFVKLCDALGLRESQRATLRKNTSRAA